MRGLGTVSGMEMPGLNRPSGASVTMGEVVKTKKKTKHISFFLMRSVVRNAKVAEPTQPAYLKLTRILLKR